MPFSSINIVPGAPPPLGLENIAREGVQPDLATPASVSYTLTIQQEIAPQTTVSVAYIGGRGYHELLSIDANVPVPSICPTGCPAGYPAGAYYYPANAPLANPNLANTTHWFSWGVSNYNGFQLDVVHHLSHGFQLRGGYTFSKSLDEGSSFMPTPSPEPPMPSQ